MEQNKLKKYLHCKLQMQLKEVILDGSDISKAIVEYATSHAITDIVVGASTRNTFIRCMTVHSSMAVLCTIPQSLDNL